MRLPGYIAAVSTALALAAGAHLHPARAQDLRAAGSEEAAAESPAPAGDPAWRWKAWPDLDRAIALRPLDGPEDILEKADIIADRLDTLAGEGRGLEKRLEGWKQRHAGLEVQTESLEDLAAVQRGADVQLQQRIHALRADLRHAAQRRRLLRAVLAALRREEARLHALFENYRSKAAELKRREGGAP